MQPFSRGCTLIVVLAIVFWCVRTVNDFKKKEIRVEEGLSGVEVALTKRYDIKQSSLIFGIRMRKNTWYAAISEWFAEYLPERAEISRTVSEGGVVRVKLSAPQDILICKDAIRESLRYQISKFHTFDCCGRFEQCSDALRCLHPNHKAALGCSYKRNLLSGKVFYGKNKNIP